MIKMHNFNEAHQHYKQHKIDFRLLQDQAFIILAVCQNISARVTKPQEITESDIAYLIQQPEASQDYNDYLGGDVRVCETEQDLLKILGCDFDWAAEHNRNWPNVTDIAMAWDVCNYLDETSGDPQLVMFVMCWNNAGGPVYYVPRHLWEEARAMEHIAATNQTQTR